MKALVVGAGQMGRWLGEVLLADGTADVSLAYADADEAAAEAAASALDAGVVREADGAAADLVCIAVPIPAAPAAIETWAGVAADAVVDVTGTMAAPVGAMREHAPDLARASFHPLFAPANEPGNVAVVVDAGWPALEVVRSAIADRGNTLYETTPTEHDEAMATVQARTHAAVLAYALAAEPVPEALHTPVSAGLESLVDQVTGGEARVYADIQAAFEGAEDVAEAASRLAEADETDFEVLYEAAGE
jgi:prephenate dehydrogenase